MPDIIPFSHLGEDPYVALCEHGTPPRNETAFLLPLNKPAGEDPLVNELVKVVQA